MKLKRTRRFSRSKNRTNRLKKFQHKFQHNFGNKFTDIIPTENSSHVHLLGTLLLILLIRSGLKSGHDLGQEIKNSEYGALLNLSIESIFDMLSVVSKKLNLPALDDKRFILFLYLAIVSLLGVRHELS